MTPRRGPLQPTRAGCLAIIIGGTTGTIPCPREALWAGTIDFPATRETWHAYACPDHHHHLDDAHPLTDADHADLEKRRHNWNQALQGHPWHAPTPLRRPKKDHP